MTKLTKQLNDYQPTTLNSRRYEERTITRTLGQRVVSVSETEAQLDVLGCGEANQRRYEIKRRRSLTSLAAIFGEVA